jgi:hypothetical protein
MIASSDPHSNPLIKGHHVDAGKGIITLTIPDIDSLVATSIQVEVEGLSHNTNFPAQYDFQYHDKQATITISSPDTATLAMNAAKFMTRRIELTDEFSKTEKRHYADINDTTEVLSALREHAKQASSNVALAIDKLISTTQMIERM